MRPVTYPRPSLTLGIDGNVIATAFNYLAPVTGTATSIALAQAATGGTALSLSGTTAGVLDIGRLVTAVSSNAGDTFNLTITGTNWFGVKISEVLALNGTTPVVSANDYLTVTSVVPASTSAGNISVGTVPATGPIIANGPPIPCSLGAAYNVALNVKTSGTVNWSVQQTFDNPFVAQPDTACTWAAVVAGLTSQTGAANADSIQPAQAYRLVINTNTAPGGALINIVENTGITAV